MSKLNFICIAVIAIACGCNKENSIEEKKPLDKEYEAKLFRYIENTIGVSKENIQYNTTKDSLILNGNYKVGIKTISKEYDSANIYKQKFENQRHEN